MSIENSLPALLADLRELRTEIDGARAAGRTRGGDPLLKTANDLALEIMRLGGLSLLVPPQWSGHKPSVEVLARDMIEWRKANAPREVRDEPIRVERQGRRY